MKREETFIYKSPVVTVIEVTIQKEILAQSLTGDVDPTVPGYND